VDKTNAQLSEYEKIKRFRLVCEEWTTQTGELSPTLKLRRSVVYQKYDNVLRNIYRYPKSTEINGNGNH